MAKKIRFVMCILSQLKTKVIKDKNEGNFLKKFTEGCNSNFCSLLKYRYNSILENLPIVYINRYNNKNHYSFNR